MTEMLKCRDLNGKSLEELINEILTSAREDGRMAEIFSFWEEMISRRLHCLYTSIEVYPIFCSSRL